MGSWSESRFLGPKSTFLHNEFEVWLLLHGFCRQGPLNKKNNGYLVLQIPEFLGRDGQVVNEGPRKPQTHTFRTDSPGIVLRGALVDKILDKILPFEYA